MLVVRIELWPLGNYSRRRTIGTVVISNDGTGTLEDGNYDCALAHAESHNDKTGAWKGGRVTDHPRRLSPYHLPLRAIDACLKGRKSKRADQLVEKANKEVGKEAATAQGCAARDGETSPPDELISYRYALEKEDMIRLWKDTAT